MKRQELSHLNRIRHRTRAAKHHNNSSESKMKMNLETFPATLLLSVVLWLPTVCLASAQYSIDWFTIDGGGGTSTGGVYQVIGTVGQPDAGPAMSGVNFSVAGGFWSILSAVQTPGAPLLTIAQTITNTVAISWASASTSFSLQQNTNGLATTNWSNVLTTPSDDGTTKTVLVNPATGNTFYRLIK